MPGDGEALERGAGAFMAGQPRTRNPYDPSSEEWMCWRDGWEQAKAAFPKRAESNDMDERADGSM